MTDWNVSSYSLKTFSSTVALKLNMVLLTAVTSILPKFVVHFSFSRNITHKLAFIIVSCWILSSDFSLTLQPSFLLDSNAQNCPKFQSILASRAKREEWEDLWERQLQSNLNLECFNRFSLPTTPKWNTLDSQITQSGLFMDSKLIYIILKKLVCQEHD